MPKSTKREPQTKSFVKGHKKIAEQGGLLGYYYISQKFLSVEFGFGLCENSHNAKAKKSKRKYIFFKSATLKAIIKGEAPVRVYKAHFSIQK